MLLKTTRHLWAKAQYYDTTSEVLVAAKFMAKISGTKFSKFSGTFQSILNLVVLNLVHFNLNRT
jgi:hypothetical protein